MTWVVTEHAIDRFLVRADRARELPRDRAKVRGLLETMAAHGQTLDMRTPHGDELREFGSVLLVIKRCESYALVVTVLHWRQLLAHGVAR